MSRLTDVFARRGERAALVTYFCAGDPDAETTIEVAVAAAEEGADILELGMPFSDPAADGVAIQRASERALAKGMTLRKTLEELVDFSLLNQKRPRLTVGTAHVRTSMMHYFDSREMELTPNHIMASGALPPATLVARLEQR